MSQQHRKRHSVLLGILLCITSSGCQREGIRTAPVTGIVTLNGKPLVDATVVFQPVAAGNSGPPSGAETDESGEFTLAFADDKPGAVVGKHRVMISTRKASPSPLNEDAEIEVVKEKVPEIYQKTPLIFEVPEGGTQDARIELTGLPPAPHNVRR